MGKRLLCLLLIAALFGVCLGGIQADPTLCCPTLAKTEQTGQTDQPMQLLPRTVHASPTEGIEQETQVHPQQQPSLCGSILPLEISDSQRFIGPTLKSRYQQILGSRSLRFIVSYIQCQGGTTSGTVTNILL